MSFQCPAPGLIPVQQLLSSIVQLTCQTTCIMHALWLVLTYVVLEDRHTDDIISSKFYLILLSLNGRMFWNVRTLILQLIYVKCDQFFINFKQRNDILFPFLDIWKCFWRFVLWQIFKIFCRGIEMFRPTEVNNFGWEYRSGRPLNKAFSSPEVSRGRECL